MKRIALSLAILLVFLFSAQVRSAFALDSSKIPDVNRRMIQMDLPDDFRSQLSVVKVDVDGDGILNQDDDDIDGDGQYNDDDPCPYDKDDLCVKEVIDDTDGDGVFDDEDNCLQVINEDQADLDEDGVGDLCDEDVDGDLVLDAEDNCPLIDNVDQEDIDEDGIGDLCDECPDDFGVSENAGCPLVSSDDEDVPEASDASGDASDSSDEEVPFPGVAAAIEDDGGCSLVPGTTINPLVFVMMAATLLPLPIFRRRKQ